MPVADDTFWLFRRLPAVTEVKAPSAPGERPISKPEAQLRLHYSEGPPALGNILANSIGKGKITVEFFSPARTFSVLR